METTYKYRHHAQDIFQGLNDFRRQGLLCDAKLKTSDGENFFVHRNILAAASPYFRSMFCGGFKEAQNDRETPIVFQNVSVIGLQVVLDCIYTDTLTLTMDTVYEVLTVAHMCCLENIVNSCKEYMVEQMSVETCFKSLNFAERLALSDVNTAAEKYILRNFLNLSKTRDFLEISCDTLCRYLQDDTLMVKEIDIFRAAARWLEFEEGRREHADKVMRHINFKAIAVDKLTDELMDHDFNRNDKECLKMVLDALKYRTNIYSQPLNGPNNTRGTERVIVIEEGECGTKGYSTVTPGKMYIYNKSDIQAVGAVNATLPCEVQSLEVKLIEASMNLVTLGNFLFLFGTDSKTYNTVTMRFDGSTNVWTDLAPIPREAAVASTSGLVGKRHIVSVGGMLVTKQSKPIREGSKLDYSAYCYSVRKNQWSIVARFPSRIAYAVSCSSQDMLYVAGGVVPRVNRPSSPSGSASVYTWNKLYSYDTKANMWLSKASMAHARSEAIFEAINTQLFVLGGCRDEDDEPVPSIEVYDIETNQWSFVEKEPGFPYDAAASFTDGEKIFLVGGYNYEKDLASDCVSVFSVGHGMGSKHITLLKPKLKNITCQHVCAVLKMPLSM